MFLEADILLIDDLHSEPIMAHPPETQSDLTFSEWLDLTILERRGLKLDLKTANSIEYCLNLLNSKQYEVLKISFFPKNYYDKNQFSNVYSCLKSLDLSE